MITQAKILVVDDDPEVLDTVGFLLAEAGYQVESAHSGPEALAILANNAFDLAIVDLILPGGDGLSLTRRLKEHNDIGVIILSGLSETTDRVVGLEVGADDYITKPYDTRELLARVRSVLRRVEAVPKRGRVAGKTYVFDGWSLDVVSMKLTAPGGHVVDITSGEFNLLKTFVENPNMVLSRHQLLGSTHQTYTPAFDRSIDVQVGRLRKKIESDPKKPQFIKTVRNAGYMFAAHVLC